MKPIPKRGRPPVKRLSADTVAGVSIAEAKFISNVISAQTAAVKSKEWKSETNDIRRSVGRSAQGRAAINTPGIFAVLLLADLWHDKTGSLPASSGTKVTDFQQFVEKLCTKFGFPEFSQRQMRDAVRQWKLARQRHVKYDKAGKFQFFSISR